MRMGDQRGVVSRCKSNEREHCHIIEHTHKEHEPQCNGEVFDVFETDLLT